MFVIEQYSGYFFIQIKIMLILLAFFFEKKNYQDS